MSKKKRVKALAVAIIRHEGMILVGEGVDPTSRRLFYRPIGGSIEFGERACDAVVREFQEELGITIVHPRQLGVIENLFTYDGEAGHEIMLVFEAELYLASLYQRVSFERIDKDGRALWMHLSSFEKKLATLYPEGLLPLLAPLVQEVL